MVKIAPSILSANFCELGKAARDCEAWGADYLHCDVMDGSYVANITFGQGTVKALHGYTRLPLDVHLMINNPDKYINEFVDAGASIITFHPETCNHPHRVLQQIKNRGIRGGIALNPGHSVRQYEPMLEDCDIVLIMSVNPGFGGQSFIRSVLGQLTWLRDNAAQRGLGYEIEVDGGINEVTAKVAVSAGANVLVSGNTIFTANDPAGAIKKLRGHV